MIYRRLPGTDEHNNTLTHAQVNHMPHVFLSVV